MTPQEKAAATRRYKRLVAEAVATEPQERTDYQRDLVRAEIDRYVIEQHLKVGEK